METRAQSLISQIHRQQILTNERSYLNRITFSEDKRLAKTDYQGFVVGYDSASGRYVLAASGNRKLAAPVQNKALGIGQNALLRTVGGGSVNWI